MNTMYLSLFVSIIALGFLYFLKTKKLKFGLRVLTAMLLGVAVGAIFKKDALIIEPVGKVFVGLIKMIVIPLVISAIITSITSMNGTDSLRKIGIKTVALLLITSAIAAAIGIGTGIFFNVGEGITYTADASFQAREIPQFSKVLMDMLPTNPIAAMAGGQVIPVVIFALFIAIAIVVEGKKKPEAVKPVKEFFNSLAQIMFRITKMVIKLAPYGTYALIASIAAKNGLSTLIPLAKFIIAVYVGCLLQIAIVHSSLLKFVAKVSPIRFFKKIYPAQAVAFTTQSSYGTLPVTIKSLVNRVGVSEKIASFAAPTGATLGMNACGALYPAMVAVLVAKVFNIDLAMSDYLMIVLLTVIGSLGTAGVPGTASIATTVVLSGMGLPVEGIAIVLGIDVVVDMMRTLTNVTGASVVALLVANSENEFDRAKFENDKADELELDAA